MPIDNILQQKHLRRNFLLATGCSLALILAVRYILLPVIDPSYDANLISVIAAVCDNLFTTLFVTIGIGVVLFWLTPINREAKIEPVDPAALPEAFENAMQNTVSWSYRGGCGTYLCTVTLPTLAKKARNTSSFHNVDIQVIDPDNETACSTYAEYRRSLQSASNDADWSIERVRHELAATLITCCFTAHAEPMLRLSIGLHPYWSTFRFDLADSCVLVTRENRRAPALKAEKGTLFYKYYRDELAIGMKQARAISALPALSQDALTRRSVIAALRSMGIAHVFTDIEIDEVIKKTRERKNPYG